MANSTALNIALGVGDGFAMLSGKEFGERHHVTDDQIDEFH
jgi:hypothetical protein